MGEGGAVVVVVLVVVESSRSPVVEANKGGTDRQLELGGNGGSIEVAVLCLVQK